MTRPPAPYRVDIQSPLAQGLEGLWVPGLSGRGGTVLRDLSGHGWHGTLGNPTGGNWVTANSPLYGAIDFDTSNPYVSTAYTDEPAKLTAWALVRTSSALNNRLVIGKWGLTGNRAWRISYYPSGCRLQLDGGNSIVSSTSIQGVGWTFLTGTISDTDGHAFYIDGLLDSTAAASTYGSSTLGIDIGGLSTVANVNLPGEISLAGLHRRALSAEQVGALYHEVSAKLPTLLWRPRTQIVAAVAGGTTYQETITLAGTKTVGIADRMVMGEALALAGTAALTQAESQAMAEGLALSGSATMSVVNRMTMAKALAVAFVSTLSISPRADYNVSISVAATATLALVDVTPTITPANFSAMVSILAAFTASATAQTAYNATATPKPAFDASINVDPDPND